MSIELERKVAQVACALIWCIVAAGPVFGFAALKPVLIAQGVYHEQCEQRIKLFSGNSNIIASFNNATSNDQVEKKLCSPQDLSLNFLFTLAAVVTNVASLLVGAILDKYGPRITGIIGSGLLWLASLILSNAYWLKDHFDAYLIGYSTLALGGPFVFISCFHLANAFPQNSGLVLALLTGAFDSSSALFLIYRLVFFSSLGDKLNLSLQKFFTIYMVVPVFILVCQLIIMPKKTYQTPVAQLQQQQQELEVEDPESALIDSIVSETESINNYLPVPSSRVTAPTAIAVNRGQSDSIGLLNSINENLSRSLNSTSQSILTDQYAHNRSNSFNQKVLSSRRSSLVGHHIALNPDNQLLAANGNGNSNGNDNDSESYHSTKVNNKINDIHNTINNAITKTLLRNSVYANEAVVTEPTAATDDALDRKSLVGNVLSDSVSIIEQTKADYEIAQESGIAGALHGATIKQQISSTWFILMALFTSIQMLRINYFVATIRSQEEFLLNDPVKAKLINEFFDLALPIGGLLSIPFIGILLDNFKTITVLSILLGVSLTIGIMGIIPNSIANYIGIMLMVVYRPFYYTAVSDYCAKVFGFTTFGTVYGSIICISGLFNFVQTGLDNMTHFTFNMNPIPVNSLLTSLTAVIGFALVIFVHNQVGQKKNDKKGGALLDDDDEIANYGSTN